MKTAIAHLTSISPYGQSKHYNVEKLPKETSADYETRTWRERTHYDKDGMVYIPPMAFKNCVSECAKYLSIQIPGKGKATYTKHFEAGVLVTDPVPLGVHKDDIKGQWLYVPADGRRGGDKRVDKCFPVIQEWIAPVTFYILDDTITQDVFQEHLEEAGRFIGIGFFRPRRNGFYGRFEVDRIDWS